MLYDACCDAVSLNAGFYQRLPLRECGEEACCMRVAGADGVDCFDWYSWDGGFSLGRATEIACLAHRDDDRLACAFLKISGSLPDVF